MKMWMPALLAIIVIGIYVLPSVTARFAGSHTMEYNQSEGIYEMSCLKCHNYISDEMGATDAATAVSTAHYLASRNSLYVGADGEINITKPELPGLMGNVCLMCHLIEQDSGSLNRTHTKLTIRVCTDLDCHGNSTTRGSDIFNNAGGVGLNLSSNSDSHSGFFKGLESQTTTYVNEDGGNYSAGFFACMGCHTHVGITFNITRPNMIAFNFSKNIISGEMVGFTYDTGSLRVSGNNLTIGQKVPGSAWE